MKRETEKTLDEQRRIVAYLHGLPSIGDLRQATVHALREVQSVSGKLVTNIKLHFLPNIL
jgi:hypothetical protein